MRRFILSYYQNATTSFHILKITEPHGALELHTHDYYQIYYVEKGRIRHHLEDKSSALHRGDVFIVPPNTPHYISREEDEICFYSMSFTRKYVEDLKCTLITDFLQNLAQSEELKPVLSLEPMDSRFAETLFLRVHEEFSKKELGSDDAVRGMVISLLSLFARNYYNNNIEEVKVSFENNKELVLHCISYINEHFAEDLSLEGMLKMATMSKTTFCKLFSELTQKSFKQYLAAKRIEHAEELLKKSELKINAIAKACGYSEFSTFFRNFKSITGACPEAFRSKTP